MAANDYHFITKWRVPGTCEQVYDIIGKPEELTRWWPSVYLKVDVLEPGEPSGVGKVVDLHTKGWLPYTLKWSFRVTHVEKPRTSSLEAKGDFNGTGKWTFDQVGDEVDVVYDWRIRADKPMLQKLSWLLKPVFAANHRWAMAQGEKGLRSELKRLNA